MGLKAGLPGKGQRRGPRHPQISEQERPQGDWPQVKCGSAEEGTQIAGPGAVLTAPGRGPPCETLPPTEPSWLPPPSWWGCPPHRRACQPDQKEVSGEPSTTCPIQDSLRFSERRESTKQLLHSSPGDRPPRHARASGWGRGHRTCRRAPFLQAKQHPHGLARTSLVCPPNVVNLPHLGLCRRRVPLRGSEKAQASTKPPPHPTLQLPSQTHKNVLSTAHKWLLHRPAHVHGAMSTVPCPWRAWGDTGTQSLATRRGRSLWSPPGTLPHRRPLG